MDSIDRISMLRQLIAEASGVVYSRKKLHKLVFLLQAAGEDFDQEFIYHNYGVFSPTLAHDLDEARGSQLIAESRSVDRGGYTLSLPTDGGETPSVGIQISPKCADLVRRLAGKSPQHLEVLSTIIYLSQHYYAADAIREKLKILKPDLSDHYSAAYTDARDIFGVAV
ncbi:MAG: hypothetical protein AB1772_06050 [Candidatus Zixiibacteriota bacterium]